MKTELESVEWMPAAPLLLTCKQAAALLGCSERTVKRLVFRGELVRRKIGGSTRIPRSSVEAFIKRDHATQSPKDALPS